MVPHLCHLGRLPEVRIDHSVLLDHSPLRSADEHPSVLCGELLVVDVTQCSVYRIFGLILIFTVSISWHCAFSTIIVFVVAEQVCA